MFHAENIAKMVISILLLLAAFLLDFAAPQPPTKPLCVVPLQFQGDYFSIIEGVDAPHLITPGFIETATFVGNCYNFSEIDKTRDANGNFDADVLFFSTRSSCFQCFRMYYRTERVVEYRRGAPCVTGNVGQAGSDPMKSFCVISLDQGAITLFREAGQNTPIVNCKESFYGTYNFTYEIEHGGGGICENPGNVLRACQLPGSPYTDNPRFYMTFAHCADVTGGLISEKQPLFIGAFSFGCLGSWRRYELHNRLGDDSYDQGNNIFIAMEDLGQDEKRYRYRCMLTRDDQELPFNRRKTSMTRIADCSSLRTPYAGDCRLDFTPIIDTVSYVPPTCGFPKNFSGRWFTAGEFDTTVVINTSHIYFKTVYDQYKYKEQYFACQMTRDSRYLTVALTVGKCEVDFVCFDFFPRHENIIRYRMSKPYRISTYEEKLPSRLEIKYRQACSWSSFTIDRREADWTYETLLLDPPAPVICPIGGRYKFNQTGDPEAKYVTRIMNRGMTARPRHMINCYDYTSVLESCENNPKVLYVDAEYCATVDHNGLPISEYDQPDRELTCVGHWMEDMKSYLVTYDEEDPVSKFRCWVYDRLNWRDLVMSQANRARCGKNQTAYSYLTKDGASLSLILKENERLFDTCPQRYDTGSIPGLQLNRIIIVGASSHLITSVQTVVLAAVVAVVALLRL